jgi:hypothetical protein
MRQLRHVGLAVLALMVVSSTAFAQRRTGAAAGQGTLWELGMDAGLSFELGVPAGAAKTTSLIIPVPSVRAGFFINDEWSLEPSLTYAYSKSEGTPSTSAYALGFAGLYHFQKNRNARQVYLRPFLAIMGFSGGGASSSDQMIGVGAGLKWPRLNGRVAWRGEANLSRQMDAEITSLSLLWGLSFFTR